MGCEHLLAGLIASEGQARDLLAGQGIHATALRQAIGAAAAGVVLERSRSADQDSGALADLTRRLEAIERPARRDLQRMTRQLDDGKLR